MNFVLHCFACDCVEAYVLTVMVDCDPMRGAVSMSRFRRCWVSKSHQAYDEGSFDAAREEETENLLGCQLQHSVSGWLLVVRQGFFRPG
jgi:hypothetical protein